MCRGQRHTLPVLAELVTGLQEGAELTISYIDVNLPLSARRRELQRNFFFHCRCFR